MYLATTHMHTSTILSISFLVFYVSVPRSPGCGIHATVGGGIDGNGPQAVSASHALS